MNTLLTLLQEQITLARATLDQIKAQPDCPKSLKNAMGVSSYLSCCSDAIDLAIYRLSKTS